MKKLRNLFTLSMILLLTLAFTSCGDFTTSVGTTDANTTTVDTIAPNVETFTVTFKDYSGVTLGTVNVKSGETAVAPVTPARDGYTFKGWSDSVNDIKSNKTVVAQYELKRGNNIVDISYVIGANSTVTLTYAVKGTVGFCGMEGYVDVPKNFELNGLTQGNGATANFRDGRVYFMFASNNGQDVNEDTVLFTLMFSYSESETTVDFSTTVSDMYDQNYQDVTFSVIGEQIKLK
jgi:uncharacterized repeat protein (TIGR02543 family)